MKQLILSDEVYRQLKWLYANAKTEVSALGVTKESDLLYVEKLYVPKQECTAVTTKMDANDVADWIEDMAVQGIGLERLGRVWFHTHPDMQPNPSTTDVSTFTETFGHFDHAIMVIIGQAYALKGRLWVRQWGLAVEIPIEVDCGEPGANWKNDLDKLQTPVVTQYVAGGREATWENGYSGWEKQLPSKYQDTGKYAFGDAGFTEEPLTRTLIHQMSLPEVCDALMQWGYTQWELDGVPLKDLRDLLLSCETCEGSGL